MDRINAVYIYDGKDTWTDESGAEWNKAVKHYRAMMGEYIIYYRGRIAGGIYDDRLLVKPTKSAVSYLETATYEFPYEGAKEMLLVEDVDSKEYLAGLFHAMYDELPVHKSNKKPETNLR